MLRCYAPVLCSLCGSLDAGLPQQCLVLLENSRRRPGGDQADGPCFDYGQRTPAGEVTGVAKNVVLFLPWYDRPAIPREWACIPTRARCQFALKHILYCCPRAGRVGARWYGMHSAKSRTNFHGEMPASSTRTVLRTGPYNMSRASGNLTLYESLANP
ncbi:hypothetical protein P280DRAFT_83400 [Massarina eburnea CBS 473.64]|uniref:Uncharacterized protein n=1 Tax=Massarina eburnea CBS 473.64 TaxID=1395130 RepID=A0A6A6RSM8_9PLEO|nr:hypothetical protein P280DRAFT_83400 [Massarina eburnea CBS 473.64]